MANSYFQFKQFIVHQDKCAMKVTTDGCLFGAWAGEQVRRSESRESWSVLDIGTGTGLLGLMLAQKNNSCNIDAIEIDNEAFEQASQNAAASPWADRIHIIHADAKEYAFSKKYDTIICNPPFYEKELKGDDPKKNIAHHDEGLLLPDLPRIIKNNLVPGGIFFLLLPYKRNEEIKKMLVENEMHVEQLVLVRQTPHHDYFRILVRGSLATGGIAETTIHEISIKENGEQYTPEFQSLLKEYYLHL